VLKSQFNPVWESFDIHELFRIIRESWLTECSKLGWCDLDGYCSLHSWHNFQKPADILLAVKQREDSLYEHRFTTSTASVARGHKRKASGTELVQQSLLEYVHEGHLARHKRIRLQTASPNSGGSSPTGEGSASNSKEFPEPRVEFAPAKEPALAVDLSVSCLSNDVSLPHRPLPEGAELCSWLRHWEVPSGRLSLMQSLEFDIRKSDFFSRREMVSRKRTRNLGDLFRAWRNAATQLPIEQVDMTLDDVSNWA
jgi:hypothetical protein